MNASTGSSVMFVSHGGGPLPLLGDPAHGALNDSLRELAGSIPRPSAIVVISAHWEAQAPTLTGASAPGLLYDYYGFPDAAYQITYPAPGDPRLAASMNRALKHRGIDSVVDQSRAFDHGVFVPLKIMYPDADIPCVQLSLVQGLDPSLHLQIGRALADMTAENLLVVGSGFSFHNLQAFFTPSNDEERRLNGAFEQWLIETCTSQELTEADRADRLIHWASAPGARYCHPREEHLLPLHVCYGIAQRPASRVVQFEVMGKMASAYLWQK